MARNRNNRNNKIIILAGGGNSDQSKKIDSFYINSFEIKSILYIPIALNKKETEYNKCLDWMNDWVCKITQDNIKIVMCTNLSQNIDLNDYDSVYIGGGNTFFLLNQIKKNNWDKKLTDFYNQGGIIYGGSAGAIILGKSILTVKEETLDNSDIFDASGLGLVDGLIRCHWNNDKDNIELTKYLNKLSKDLNRQLLLLKEEGGIAIVNDEFKEF